MKRIFAGCVLVLAACTNGSGIEAEDNALEFGVETDADGVNVENDGGQIVALNGSTDGDDSLAKTGKNTDVIIVGDAGGTESAGQTGSSENGAAAPASNETPASGAAPASGKADAPAAGKAPAPGEASPSGGAAPGTSVQPSAANPNAPSTRRTTTTSAIASRKTPSTARTTTTTKSATTARGTETTRASSGAGTPTTRATTPTTARQTTTTARATATTARTATTVAVPPSTSVSGGESAGGGDVVAPVVAGDYYETFDSRGSMGSLDFFVTNARMFNDRPATWPGEHAAGGDCSGPDTNRTINWPDPAGNEVVTRHTNAGEVAYWCAPGGPGSGHMMTSFLTRGYSHVDFAPKRTFSNVRRVCYDINATNLGNRKWSQFVVVKTSVADPVAPRLDWTHPSFQERENGPASWGLGVTPGVFMFMSVLGGAEVVTGGGARARGNLIDKSVSDQKKRVTTCVTDVGSGQVEVAQERWDGRVDVTMLPGSFPTGPVKVVFQDAGYNPDKAKNESTPLHAGYTWHWDNLYVSSNASNGVINVAQQTTNNTDNIITAGFDVKTYDSGLFCGITTPT